MNEKDRLPFAPAAERNREPILAALAPRLRPDARVLEIGSGTGQHAVAFAAALGQVCWQPTEREPALPGLAARIRAEGGDNVLAPMALDVRQGPWPEAKFDAVFTANTIHIMSWDAVLDLVAGVALTLRPDGPFMIYGPFRRNGRHTAASNERFHQALRDSDPAQGVRDLEDLESEARRHQLELEEVLELPANNLMVIFRRHERDR